MVSEPRRIVFPYARTKWTEVVRWFLDMHGGGMDLMKLMKLIFLADKAHLVKYGRPIVGGHYYAMRFGPISSELLSKLRHCTGTEDVPFIRTANRISPVGGCGFNEDEFSESDLEILEEVNSEYGRMDSISLADLTHHMQLWQKNFPDPAARTSRPIPYEDFFLEDGDKSMLELIREHQEAMEFLN
ncbi:MAG: Panacea domain-containing protein [Planctomycetia bacterium]|nr:Panacea domain-containing protein [Planctomycetia bacterium]